MAVCFNMPVNLCISPRVNTPTDSSCTFISDCTRTPDAEVAQEEGLLPSDSVPGRHEVMPSELNPRAPVPKAAG